MSVTDKQLANLIPAKKGEVRNPNGKPKGTKHISTWIQELLEDDEFEADLIDSKKGLVEFKGAPIKAIILATRHMAVNGDKDAREWLAKYGWGTKLTHANDPDNPLTDTKHMSKEQLEDAIRDVLGSTTQSGGTLRASPKPPES